MNSKVAAVVTGLHASLYKAFSGKILNTFGGSELLLLTTKGRKTGKMKTTPLVFIPWNNDEYVVSASMLGSPKHPGWYHNILANQDQVSIQIGAKKSAVNARVLEGEERELAWSELPDNFNDYQSKTSRRIPLVSLKPE